MPQAETPPPGACSGDPRATGPRTPLAARYRSLGQQRCRAPAGTDDGDMDRRHSTHHLDASTRPNHRSGSRRERRLTLRCAVVTRHRRSEEVEPQQHRFPFPDEHRQPAARSAAPTVASDATSPPRSATSSRSATNSSGSTSHDGHRPPGSAPAAPACTNLRSGGRRTETSWVSGRATHPRTTTAAHSTSPSCPIAMARRPEGSTAKRTHPPYLRPATRPETSGRVLTRVPAHLPHRPLADTTRHPETRVALPLLGTERPNLRPRHSARACHRPLPPESADRQRTGDSIVFPHHHPSANGPGHTVLPRCGHGASHDRSARGIVPHRVLAGIFRLARHHWRLFAWIVSGSRADTRSSDLPTASAALFLGSNRRRSTWKNPPGQRHVSP